MAGTLMTHSDKFKCQHVTLADLKALPDPQPMGPHHKPVRHDVLIEAIHAEAQIRSLTITREQFAMGAKTAALFGVIDFELNAQATLVKMEGSQTGLSFGFRSANDLSLAIRAVAGARVFVCDNLAMAGQMFAISRKHTFGLDLAAAVQMGFDRFLSQADGLAAQIDGLAQRGLDDSAAKVLIFDLFSQAILPVKLFDDVNHLYFDQSDERPDCLPRTAWGLHNAVTRAIKSLKPVPAFERTLAVGRFFGLSGQGGDVTLVEDVR